jgi:acyl carrier protein
MEMTQIKSDIRRRIVELAAALGHDATALPDDELIPMAGYLDSAALFDLIAWYEKHFGLQLKQEEINIDNMGTIDAMAEFAARRRA